MGQKMYAEAKRGTFSKLSSIIRRKENLRPGIKFRQNEVTQTKIPLKREILVTKVVPA